MATSVALQALATGTFLTALPGGVAQFGAGRPVYVYVQGTVEGFPQEDWSAFEVPVYADSGLTLPLVQPLTTGPTGAIPGWIQAEQSIEFYDQLSLTPIPAEAIRAADFTNVPTLQGPTGATGPAGALGATGAQGPIGPAGANFEGTWGSGTTYSTGQWVIASNSQPYVSVANSNVGNNPISDGGMHWQPWLPTFVANASSLVLAAPAPSGDTSGATDYTAIASLITELTSGNGGTLQLQPGTYYLNTALNLSEAVNVTLLGPAAAVNGYSGSLPVTTLVFTVTGSGDCINVKSSQGVNIRNLGVRHNSGSFTGYIIDAAHGGDSDDCTYLTIENCLLGGVFTVYSAAACVRLQDAIITRIVGCHIQNAVCGVRCRDDASGYSNAHQIIDSTFDNLTTAAIMNAGQKLSVIACTFEGTNDGESGGMPRAYYDDLPADSISEAVSFIGCWFGDDIASSSGWIANQNGEFFGLTIVGCDFRQDNGNVTHSLDLSALSGQGLFVSGNSMGGASGAILMPTASSGGSEAWNGVTIVGNDFQRAGSGSVNPLLHVTDGYHKNVLVFGNSANVSSIVPPTLLRSSTTYEIDVDESGVITLSRPTNGGAIQINGSIGVDGGGGNKVSFYGATPIVQPTVSGSTLISTLATLGLVSSSSTTAESVNTVTTGGSAQTIPDVSSDSISYITMTANCTLTFPTAAAGKSFLLALKQGGSGSYTATWPSSIIKWSGGTAPTLTTTVGKTDVFSFVCLDGTNWISLTVGQNF